jgi:outer membrane lipoprotein carrier protein
MTSVYAALLAAAVAAGGSAPPAPTTASPAASPSSSPSASTSAATDELVRRVQAFYEKAHDLSARFVQTYENRAFHQTLQSEGRFVFKKPGMIRFDYEKPEPKFFVVKHDQIVSYSPAAQQAMTGTFHADQLSASVTFLFGKGDLAAEFRVSKVERPDLGPGTALQLVPKKADPRFDRLFLVVDPKSDEVRESLVVDGSGNENRFVFSDVKVNAGVPESAFEVKLPEGTQVLKMGEGK